MKVADHVRHKLQGHANRLLSLEYDGSGDWWGYVTVFDKEYGINIWSADEWGDGSTKSGLRITVYETDAVTGDTVYDDYTDLDADPLPLKICKLRLKVKDAVSCD